MSGEKMQRTTYRDPTQSSSPLRLEDPVDRAIEAARDMDDFYLPLARVHGSSLHGWGIAAGLAVTATPNTSGLNVLPALPSTMPGGTSRSP
jgi:hypothetical protein